MKGELVSIVISIYNVERFLQKCLESVINQTYCNLDIILINDGSTDNSLSIAEEFEKKDSRVRVVSQENEGLIATRKKGVELAKGELIAFVDGDDWIERDMYEQLATCMIESKSDLVSSGIFHDYQDGRVEECHDIYAQGKYSNLSKEIFPNMLYDFKQKEMGMKCTLVNKIFRKSILQEIYGNIDTRVFYGEDALTLYQYCLKCSSIYILKESYYHYYIRNGSMCRSANEELASNTYYLFKGLKAAFMASEDSLILMKQLKQYVLQLESHTLKMLFDIDTVALANWDFSRYQYVYGKRIVIYGAGACGQAFYRQAVSRGQQDTIVAWIDQHAEAKMEQCMYNILFPEDIVDLKYDYIVIAIKNEMIAMKVKQNLIRDYDIQENKIVWELSSYESLIT